MGYRSDVAFACDPIVKDIVQTVAEWDKEFRELLEYADNLSNDDFGRWLFSDVKWYESYPDVDAIEQFVTEAESDEYKITDDDGNKLHSSDLVRFVRVGEDNDDITVRGHGFWDIHPVTSINW